MLQSDLGVFKWSQFDTQVTSVGKGSNGLWRRLRNVSTASQRPLDAANVPYAVVGGKAVQIWVAQVDESAVRNTRDVDIVLNRNDLEPAKSALEAAGFVYRHFADVTMFLDGPDAKARDAVHVVFAGEKVRPEYS